MRVCLEVVYLQVYGEYLQTALIIFGVLLTAPSEVFSITEQLSDVLV